MPFVFSKLFYLLVIIGIVPLSLSWERPWLRWATLAYDIALLLLEHGTSPRSSADGRPAEVAVKTLAARWHPATSR